MYNHFVNFKKEDLYNEEKKLISVLKMSKLFRENSFLKYSKLYPSLNEYYIYDASQGIYIKFNDDGFKSMIAKIFTFLDIEVNYPTILKIYNNFKVGALSIPENEVFVEESRVCFTNGILNLQTGEFLSHSPEFFITSKLQFNYDKDAEAGVVFTSYIDSFCNNNKEKILFLKSWFKLLIMRSRETQTFIYIQGQAKTGKSVVGHLASAMIGDVGTVVTSLRSLNNDMFEIYNLKDKNLIIISDTEYYAGDLSILKQAVGGDALKGRIKFVQGSVDVYAKGLVMIIGNYGFNSQDTSGAIERRLRLFKADNLVKESVPLLYKINKMWCGPLADELSGIFNWAFNFDLKEAIKVISNPKKHIPSVYLEMENENKSINPITEFIHDNIIKGPGCYLGYSDLSSSDSKDLLEMQRRRLLYPTYVLYCKQRGYLALKHKLFSTELLSNLKKYNYACQKVKRSTGVFIEGICLKHDSFSLDNLYGGTIIDVDPEPLKLLTESEKDFSKQESQTNDSSERKDNYEHIVYKTYMSYLSSHSNEKESLNSFIKNNSPNIDTLLSIYLKNTTSINEEYKALVKHTFTKNLKIITKYGGIPYNYKRMGVSPRIIPINYGDTINNTKKVLRTEVYKSMAGHIEDYCIVDFDLKSCYTSILLGLYPKDLKHIQQAIEGPGLWKFIEGEFQNNNKLHMFNKPAVKVCVYSSFFLGGTTAMMEGITDNIRKDIGLTKPDFRKSIHYEEAYRLAQNVTSQMINSSIIIDFRSISQKIFNLYKDKQFICPTNQKYTVTKENFRNVYPNYLQSFEICLLAVSTVKVIEKYPEVQIIGHYHDGNTLLIPHNIKHQVIEFYKNGVSELGFSLGLHYKQELEVKDVF